MAKDRHAQQGRRVSQIRPAQVDEAAVTRNLEQQGADFSDEDYAREVQRTIDLATRHNRGAREQQHRELDASRQQYADRMRERARELAGEVDLPINEADYRASQGRTGRPAHYMTGPEMARELEENYGFEGTSQTDAPEGSTNERVLRRRLNQEAYVEPRLAQQDPDPAAEEAYNRAIEAATRLDRLESSQQSADSRKRTRERELVDPRKPAVREQQDIMSLLGENIESVPGEEQAAARLDEQERGQALQAPMYRAAESRGVDEQDARRRALRRMSRDIEGGGDSSGGILL